MHNLVSRNSISLSVTVRLFVAAKMAKINGSKQIGQLINQLVNTILKLQTVRVPTAAHRSTVERLKVKQCDSTDVDDIPFEPSAFQND